MQRSELNAIVAAQDMAEGKEVAPTSMQIVIDESILSGNIAAIQEQEAELLDNMDDINSLKGNAMNKEELTNLRWKFSWRCVGCFDEVFNVY